MPDRARLFGIMLSTMSEIPRKIHQIDFNWNVIDNLSADLVQAPCNKFFVRDMLNNINH